MLETKEKIHAFLKRHGMYSGLSDIDALLEDFVGDMKAGLSGDVRSMLMIPTYINLNGELPKDEPIIVMDAGGTNFRIALVTFGSDGETVIEHFAKYPMPGSQGRITLEQFTDLLLGYMAPVMEKSDKVGFCFSFPTVITPNRDGKLLAFNKEISVTGSDGMMVGETINAALKARGLKEKQFVLLNDTVAAMCSGLAGKKGKSYGGFIGLILGTGTNTCYVESTANITAVREMSGTMAVNMESGGYCGVPQGEYDKALDAASNDPGVHIYEKMVSGAYQGDCVYRTLCGAAADGLFSASFKAFTEAHKTLSTRDIDEFMRFPFGDNLLAKAVAGQEADRLALHYIIDDSFERSARLMTVNIGGILLKTNTGADPTRPVCVIAEGTSFQKSEVFRNKLNAYLKQELNDKRGLYCELVHIPDATLTGSAAAGLIG